MTQPNTAQRAYWWIPIVLLLASTIITLRTGSITDIKHNVEVNAADIGAVKITTGKHDTNFEYIEKSIIEINRKLDILVNKKLASE